MVGRLSRMRVSSVVGFWPPRSSSAVKSTRPSTRPPPADRGGKLFIFLHFVFVLVLLLVSISEDPFVLAKNLLVRESPEAFPWHLHNPHGFSLRSRLVGAAIASHQNVEASRAFKTRPRAISRNRPDLGREFSVPAAMFRECLSTRDRAALSRQLCGDRV